MWKPMRISALPRESEETGFGPARYIPRYGFDIYVLPGTKLVPELSDFKVLIQVQNRKVSRTRRP